MPVYKDKNGRYYLKISINGKQILKRGYETKEAALQEIINLKALNEVKPKNKKYPYFNDLVKDYIKYKKKLVKKSSIYCIEKSIEARIIGCIRNVPIDKLINKDFDNYRKYLSKLDIKYKTKNKYIKILKDIFNYCYLYFEYDCIFVKRLLLFKDDEIVKPKKDYKIFTNNDFKLLYPILDNYNKLLLLTFYLFGLRIGEVLGLTVLSFKSFQHTLCVYQEVSWKTNKKGFELLSPKSKTSNRNYPIPEKYEIILNNHIKDNNLKDEEFIFFGKKGKNSPISEHAVNNRLKHWSKIVGYHIHSHIFRHSAVSQLYANNVPLELISDLVGHSSTAITKQVYLHQTEEKKQAISNFMNGLIE